MRAAADVVAGGAVDTAAGAAGAAGAAAFLDGFGGQLQRAQGEPV